MKNSIAILPTSPSLEQTARAVANQLNLPLILHPTEQYDYLFLITPDYVALQKNHDKKSLPVYINFLSKKFQYRKKNSSTLKENLVRALGLKKNQTATIIDATGGLAQDSFVLAHLGFEVKLLERSSLIHALLQDGIHRGLKELTIAPMIKRLHLIHADAIKWLKNREKIEYIYLDPMFPERKKSALVKKEMQFFQDIIGDDHDADLLLKTALACATKRVVVKRPRLAPLLIETPAPHFQLKGKSIRFDVYLTG